MACGAEAVRKKMRNTLDEQAPCLYYPTFIFLPNNGYLLAFFRVPEKGRRDVLPGTIHHQCLLINLDGYWLDLSCLPAG